MFLQNVIVVILAKDAKKKLKVAINACFNVATVS